MKKKKAKQKIKPREKESSRKPVRRAGIWQMSQNNFVSLAAEWEWTHTRAPDGGMDPDQLLPWARSLWIKPSSYSLPLSFPVGRALICPCPSESRQSRLARAMQLGFYVPSCYSLLDVSTLDMPQWGRDSAQLGWQLQRGVTAQGPPQLLGGSWAEFVSA